MWGGVGVAGKCSAGSIFKELPSFEHVLVGVIGEEMKDIFSYFCFLFVSGKFLS